MQNFTDFIDTESLGIFVDDTDSHLSVSPMPEIGFTIGAMDQHF